MCQANDMHANHSVLLNTGADMEAKTRKTLRSPLHWVASSPPRAGHVEVARLLLDAGADIEAADVDGTFTSTFNGTLGGASTVTNVL